MMKATHNMLKLTVMALVAATAVQAQQPAALPPDHPAGVPVNSIKIWEAAKPGLTPATIQAQGFEAVKQTAQYFDGLGRPLQTVARQGSQNSFGPAVDVVSAHVYDPLGREALQYLPFNANSAGGNTSLSDGAFKPNAFAQQQAFMQQQYGGQGETFFYGQTEFEPSPLNRPLKTMAPGNSWVGAPAMAGGTQGRGVATGYWHNSAADSVRLWEVGPPSTGTGPFGTYSSPGTYPADRLAKTVVTDEHGKQVIEFKNSSGQVVLKKVQLTAVADTPANSGIGGGRGHTGWLCTYYVYDRAGNLRCVLQPKAVEQLVLGNWVLGNGVLDGLAFQYAYQAGTNLMTAKKVPGAGEVEMVYDARRRLVLVRDANQKGQGKWLYTQYDALNRPIATGLWANTQTAEDHRAAAAISGNYPNLAGQTHEVLTETYYDNYDWLAGQGHPFAATRSTADDGQFYAQDDHYYPYARWPQQAPNPWGTRGLPTGGKTKLLQGGTPQYLYSISYYDPQGRVIQAQSQNLSGGTDISTTQYGFAGQVMRQVWRHQKAGPNPQVHLVRTRLGHSPSGKLASVEKQVESTVGNNAPVTGPWKFVQRNLYNDLGQLWVKGTGNNYRYQSYHAAAEQLYSYNIRGWLTGINKGWLGNIGADDRLHFAMDLGYDKDGQLGSYAGKQYNGNISGTQWASVGDGEVRRYDFAYDAANRLLRADFAQYAPGQPGQAGAFAPHPTVNYDVKMGDGINATSAYDANGNILRMQQWGLRVNASTQIDDLGYSYQANGNRLAKVTDAHSDPATLLGDFKDGANTGNDYGYDANGNMVADGNKNIGAILYNHLNLPQLVTVPGKGTIAYTYDAAGNKLAKTVTDNTPAGGGAGPTPARVTVTQYMGAAVYENDTLQLIGHEEGRMRPVTANGLLTGMAFDYFLKDHLGNVRAVVTDELQTDRYPTATLEAGAAAQEQGYYDINTAYIKDKPSAAPDYVNDNGTNNPNTFADRTANSQKMYQLNAATNKTGLGMVLKVMAGDKLDVLGKSWYSHSGGAAGGSPLTATDLVNAFLGGGSGNPAVAHGATGSALLGNTVGTVNPLNAFSSGNVPNASNNVKAGICYILFDEQFKFVGGGFDPVNGGATGGIKSHFLQHIAVPKNGYLYVYCSNESNINVFFDNVEVVHTRGALLEETHYYPFGLTMSGISSQAANITPNKTKFQGQEFAHKEFSDGSGLEMYEFKYRMDDCQTGRFWQIDPLSEKYVYNSTYAFSENKVTGHRELEGLEAWNVNQTTEDGRTVLTATVSNVNAPFSVTQGGTTTGFFPNAQMNQQLGGAVVSNGSLLVPVNANGDYKMYDATTSGGAGASGFTYKTDNLALTPTTTTNVITNGAPVVLNGNRNATDPMAIVGATTLTTPPIASATAPNVNLTYSDQAGLPNTFTVTNNSTGANVIGPVRGNGTATNAATGFVSGGTISVTTTEQPRQRGDGYNYTLTVIPTVSTPTVVPTPAAAASQWRIVQGQSRSLNNNSSLY
jgi:YD repeat-containing protein